MSPSEKPEGHPFDRALRLRPAADDGNRFDGQVSQDYWNMIGPFGGMTAATALQAVLDHPQRLGLPVTLTVNFVAPLAAGAYAIEAVPVRTNRSTQHWTITITQQDAQDQAVVVLTGTAMTALRRDTWSDAEMAAPDVPRPGDLPRFMPRQALGWFSLYDMRAIVGSVPAWDNRLRESLTQLWVRDHPARALDFQGLTAMADIFFPRVWLRRATHTPVGTVSLTVYYHADEAMLARAGTGHLLGQARGQGYFKGFHDQTAQLWSEQGDLLATTHQAVYFKA